MAFQTKQVDIAAAQKPGIGRTMRRVAGYTAFGLDRRMLKSERPGFVRVATETELVLCGCGSQLVCEESAMGVMAVAAGHKPFIHFVVEWFGEIRFNVKMAGETKLRLRGL
jgi:hypothetical protein